MTKTLTEQWREGEIFGFHYVKVPGEETEIHNVSCMDYLLDEYGVEVLAPVPSYDKYNELVQKIHILEDKLREANYCLNLIEVHTGSIGQSEEDMNESLIAIMNICRKYFGEE